MGFSGPPGPPGPAGPSDESGELVVNGSFEAFTGTVPTGWTSTTPGLVAQEAAPGLVHTGLSAVSISGGGDLSQTITGIVPGQYYLFALSANTIAGGVVAFTATVTFNTTTGPVVGAVFTVPAGSVSGASYVYYYVITTAAPVNVTSATITFAVLAGANAPLTLDDVSFGTQ